MNTQDSALVAKQFQSWRLGVENELEFWERWYRTRGDQWPQDYAERLKPDRDIPPRFVEGVLAPDIVSTRVLDVGAGPVSRLGNRYAGKRINVTAVDPLAPFYSEMAQRYSVDWPVKTVEGFAEDLSAQFDPGSFDAVFCSNALDHSFDPLRGIEEMMIVVRKGGRIILEHNANEAEHEAYRGFHQYNFDVRDGVFVIWNKEVNVVVNDVLSPLANVRAHRKERLVAVSIEKLSDPPFDLSARHRLRILSLLSGVVRSSARGG